ncbi:MAG: hypothetical protein AAB965_00265 [Patescibacteria group bacterium]
MKWHKEVLIKKAQEIVGSGISYAILVLVFLLWRYALGNKFEWQNIEPLSPPSVFVRSFYSAFTFGTLGLLLYVLKFYKVLHDIVVKTLGMWKLYNFIKAVVWVFLIYASYEYIVPWLFNLLNTGVSVLFNVAGIVLYSLPPLGIAIVLSATYILFKNRTPGKTV